MDDPAPKPPRKIRLFGISLEETFFSSNCYIGGSFEVSFNGYGWIAQMKDTRPLRRSAAPLCVGRGVGLRDAAKELRLDMRAASDMLTRCLSAADALADDALSSDA
jgi:hypothetical protein